MKLTKLSPKERRRRKLGAAVEYELELDHMGMERPSAAGRPATVYLGPSQITGLWDLLDSVASKERDAVTVQIWDDLMATVERLNGEYADLTRLGFGAIATKEEILRWGEGRGKAQGLAFALALLENPRHPDIDAIRAETVERWEAAQ